MDTLPRAMKTLILWHDWEPCKYTVYIARKLQSSLRTKEQDALESRGTMSGTQSRHEMKSEIQ